MSRALVFMLLIAALLGKAVAGDASLLHEAGGDIRHAFMHWSSDGHHHHGDGLHEDDSTASLQHVLADHGGCCVIMTDGFLLVPRYAPSRSLRLSMPLHKAPSLDGPLRPPCLIS